MIRGTPDAETPTRRTFTLNRTSDESEVLLIGRTRGRAALLIALASGCSERSPVSIDDLGSGPSAPVVALQALTCTATVGESIDCAPARPAHRGGNATILGGQNLYLRLTSTNVAYDAATEIFQFDVTVQNLLNEAIGTPDGVTPDPDGVRVFFHSGPTAVDGAGAITVANADGVGMFTASDQPYFVYPGILRSDSTSSSKTWQLQVPGGVSSFEFTVFVETDVQYLLVISEVMANPAGITSEVASEWFEVYNGGTLPVEMQGLVIADSAASGRRPYHVVSAPLTIAAGEYVVLGGSADPSGNGGAPVDYAYGSALSLANSLDAVKISRVVGADTLTLDRVGYASPGAWAQDGVSRELTDLTADNSNVDVTPPWVLSPASAYGAGGRGTPGAAYRPAEP